ncbi:MAG TPA: hypothetical protein VGI18_08695 [Burkholderiales bacterium]|jgi:uncharacterized membrane protein
MKIDFKALAAGLIAALVVSFVAHAHLHSAAEKEKAGGIAPSGLRDSDAAARYG